jgi:hypothetical protein
MAFRVCAFRLCAAAICGVVLAGCSTLGVGSLLEDPKFAAAAPVSPAAVVVSNSLAVPPEDALNPALDTSTEEQDLESSVPTVAQLDAVQLPGIDAAKVAAALEEDIAAQKVSSNLKWRGRRSGDGIDVANSNGTLCSAARDQGVGPVTLACSDGRTARLVLPTDLNHGAQIDFGDTAEDVEFVQ